MAFLLDTNVVSEMVRPLPEPRVVDWMTRQVAADLFLSATTVGELVRGVTRLDAGHRRARLEEWISELLPRQFAGRILAFDRDAAIIWGKLMGEGDRAGRPLAALDAQIAALALRRDLVLVTRNTGDFEPMKLRLLNPWI